ncbi:MAG TPA: hypothetical protein VFN67_34600, partial [Polyangiales bacterium]|nr:hypothetical protein [Polyangiales bacterium]
MAVPDAGSRAVPARTPDFPALAGRSAFDRDAGRNREQEFEPNADPARLDAGAESLADGSAGTPKPPDAAPVADGCAREQLMQGAERFFEALASGDPRGLAVHPNVRYTENGQVQTLGAGLWLAAPRSEFARHVFDSAACSTLSEAVVSDNFGRIVYGVRLRYLGDQLLEIEAHVVRATAQYYEPAQIIPSGPDAWVAQLPAYERSAAPELNRLAMRYFDSAADASLL